MQLTDKVTVVTGGGIGLGAAISRRFAQAGSHIAMVSPDKKEQDELAKEIEKMGRKALSLKVDISKEDEVKQAIKAIVDKFGTIDVLVNNAGIAAEDAEVPDIHLDDWNKVLAIDLTGVMLMSREALKVMVPRKKGSLVHVSSTSGKSGHPRRAAYACAKWGVIALSETLAIEMGKHNIRSNCVCPGAMMGPRWMRAREVAAKNQGITMEQAIQQAKDNSPLKRITTYPEVAELALFLASDASGTVNGEAVLICGGSLMR